VVEMKPEVFACTSSLLSSVWDSLMNADFGCINEHWGSPVIHMLALCDFPS
jgi:hypothetical protein